MISIDYTAEGISQTGHCVYVAVGAPGHVGSAVVPFGQGLEGSTLFLPFRATQLFLFHLTESGVQCTTRHFIQTVWGTARPSTATATVSIDCFQLQIPLEEIPESTRIQMVIYAKDLRANDGWGRLITNRRDGIPGGFGDQCIRRFQEVDLTAGTSTPRSRFEQRPRIYQLLPRLFSNLNQTRKPNGTLAENGTGKFNDLNNEALSSLRSMGFTHLWLTGVQRQATATAHPGLPADDPDLLKGLAGSPYAVKDYLDLCPDYASTAEKRHEEFNSLLVRMREHGLGAIMDLVANHVSRSYPPENAPHFGAEDQKDAFFAPHNSFFHLHGQPLRLPTWSEGRALSPTCEVLGTCDGLFAPEEKSARVSGNNVTSPHPSLGDWYETVKLNYGFDFTTGSRAFPHAGQPGVLPQTWLKVDSVIAHWQQRGVAGFRCDMAHMVPPEFWSWAIARARARDPEVLFLAEAYEDPMRARSASPLLAALNNHAGHVMLDLIDAGFDAVYDHPTYQGLKRIYDGPAWANDLDSVIPHAFLSEHSVRYGENHDEVRIHSPGHWANIGPAVGKPVSALLYALSTGPILLYSGQEVGESGSGHAGFCNDPTRTTLFDYWSQPELLKWVNQHRYDGGQLSPAQRELRAFYSRILKLNAQPAFAHGEFLPLNGPNLANPDFGRLPGETASGHWIHAFLRYDARSEQRILVVVNLHPSHSFDHVRIWLPAEALAFLELPPEQPLHAAEQIGGTQTATSPRADEGLQIHGLAPLSAGYWELLTVAGE